MRSKFYGILKVLKWSNIILKETQKSIFIDKRKFDVY